MNTLPAQVGIINEKLDILLQLLSKPKEDAICVEDTMLNIQQASHLLTLSVNTIYSKVSKKEIPYYKQGKRLYFSKPILIKWIETGQQLTEMEIQTGTEIQFIEKQKKKSQAFFLKDRFCFCNFFTK